MQQLAQMESNHQVTASNDLPIWNVEELAERPNAAIFITGGAEAAIAAQTYFVQYVCLAGPLSADWSVLKGRMVHLWPDGGEAGYERMRALGDALKPIAAGITLHRQAGAEAGWNLANALLDDWTREQVMEYVKRDEGAHSLRIKELPKGRKKEAVKGAIEGEVVEPMQADINLQRDHVGRPFPTEANAIEILSKHERFKDRIWFDEFAQRLMIDDKRFDPDGEGLDALVWMQKNLDMQRMTLTSVGRAAQYVGARNPQNRLKDYLDSLTWDGQDRHSGFMELVYGTERTDYTAAIGRCWLVSAVARVYEPGCKADCMLVLEGPQGAKKSTSLSILGGDWFVESHEDPIYSRKDFLGQLQGHWIIEIPEMHSIAGAVNGIEKIKGIISCQTDDYRKVWGRTNQPHDRQCIFAGTTNARQWNSDSTGGRRFWPAMCGSIDLDYLRANREQLWAEAVARYKAGEPWWDVPVTAAQEEQDLRRRADVWEPLIEKFITHIPTYHKDANWPTWEKRSRPLDLIRPEQALVEACNRQVSNLNKYDQMRVASILGVLGWERRRETVDGARMYVYRPTIERPAVIVPVHTPPAIGFDDDSEIPY